MLNLDSLAALPFHFWSVVLFVFGSVVGSFLNVCIHRMPSEKSLISPGSHCPHCESRIPWYYNIPILSWILLRGRCAHCHTPISPRYVIVELFTAVLFTGCWLAFGAQSAPLALVYCLVFAGFIVATFIDLEHFIIPDEITIGGMVVGFLASFAVPELHATVRSEALKASFLGIAVGGALIYLVLQMGKFFFGQQRLQLDPESTVSFTESNLQLPDEAIPYDAIFTRKRDAVRLYAHRVIMSDRCYFDTDLSLSPEQLQIGSDTFAPESIQTLEVVTDQITLPREAMGMGDVKFLAAIGAFLGWQGALFSLMVSSVIGALLGIILIALGRRDWSSQIPYGPYIVVAASIWIFTGEKWVAWWLG